tara:strand:+ start:124 stop:324 length:201 start_codon:yes stop_codon:yes gene_type:complete
MDYFLPRAILSLACWVLNESAKPMLNFKLIWFYMDDSIPGSEMSVGLEEQGLISLSLDECGIQSGI